MTVPYLKRQYVFFLLISIVALIYPLRANAQFVRGADIGWLSQMEATGYKFYDTNNVQKDCLDILKERGINTVRLRVFVNPSSDKVNGHCNKKEVAAMALRAKNMGMRVMIDFHYSDSWADPGKQNKPAAWASHAISQLLTDLYDHTFEVLDTLKSIGAKPDWVQIGNEISGGMLWPEGSASNWTQLAQLLNRGYDAAKAVDSTIKVIIHLDSGNDNNKFRIFFDNAKSHGVRYDIIGASYYPYWEGHDYTVTIDDLANNLNDMTTRYGKEVMVVEVGGPYDLVQNTYDMLVAVIRKVNAVPNQMGLGVIYWEPEGEKSWSGYNLSCWNADGKPTKALNAFLIDLPTGENEIIGGTGFLIYPNPAADGLFNLKMKGMTGISLIRIYDLDGRLVNEQTSDNMSNVTLDLGHKDGIYILVIRNQDKNIIRKLMVIR
jgi:arabinogalactan endo-1,4-beta-galactosidase